MRDLRQQVIRSNVKGKENKQTYRGFGLLSFI